MKDNFIFFWIYLKQNHPDLRAAYKLWLNNSKEVIICIPCGSHTGPATWKKCTLSQAFGDATQPMMQITHPFPDMYSRGIKPEPSAWNSNDFLVNPFNKSLFVAGCWHRKHWLNCGVGALGWERDWREVPRSGDECETDSRSQANRQPQHWSWYAWQIKLVMQI